MAETSTPTALQPPNERALDRALCERLRVGDEAAFTAFAKSQHPVLLRVAASHLGARSSLVEECAQQAWVVFLESLDRYEARSSLRTFLVGILVNVLRNRVRKEAHSVPLSSLVAPVSDDEAGPTVDPGRFAPTAHAWPGHWIEAPRHWSMDPACARELRDALESAIALLPVAQRDVVTLRDVLGWDADETCNALGLTDTHHRVLLHRARAKLRHALEARFGQVL